MSLEFNAAKEVLAKAAEGIEALEAALDDNFLKAIDIIYATKGRVIISGMGKSGHIARKIAATFASTGTPAHFIHPGEASHGDLGMITKDDVVILLSNSGETAELKDIIYYVQRFSIPLIAIVRRKTSSLVAAANVAFILPEIPEASPVAAPTTSTTMMLVWGDVLAMALLEKRGFKAHDFQVYHPGGKLGSQLLKVAQVMRTENLPLVEKNTSMSKVLIEMSAKSLGCVGVAEKNMLVGMITDGDLRRHMDSTLISRTAEEVMTHNPVTFSADWLASKALGIMNERRITNVFVVEDTEIKGILHLHDVIKSGVI